MVVSLRTQPNAAGLRWSGLLFALALAGCGESKPLECSVTTEPLEAPSDGAVKYEAFTSGSAAVLSVTYLAHGVESEIENPALPWEEDLAVKSGETLSISATGTAEPGGTFTVRYSFTSSGGGAPTTTFASCGK